MDQNFHGIKFDLDSGRSIYVDLFVLETEYKDVDTDNFGEGGLPLLIKRRRMDWEVDQWFDPDEVHFIIPENFSEDQSTEQLVLVSALLWSEPVSKEFDFSELMVVFFIEYIKEMSIEKMLREGIHDLDWERLAIDRYGAIN